MWEQKVCQQVTYLVNITRDLLTLLTRGLLTPGQACCDGDALTMEADDSRDMF